MVSSYEHGDFKHFINLSYSPSTGSGTPGNDKALQQAQVPRGYRTSISFTSLETTRTPLALRDFSS